MLRDAFTHDDVRRAFEVEVTRRKAEIAAMQAGTDQATSKRAGRLLMSMMALGGALVGFGIKMVTDSDRGATWRAVGVGMIAASATLIAGGVMLMARTGSGHIEAESAGRLARIWTGAFGRRVFAIAAWLNRRQTSAAPAKP